MKNRNLYNNSKEDRHRKKVNLNIMDVFKGPEDRSYREKDGNFYRREGKTLMRYDNKLGWVNSGLTDEYMIRMRFEEVE